MATNTTPDGTHACVDEYGATLEKRTEDDPLCVEMRAALVALGRGIRDGNGAQAMTAVLALADRLSALDEGKSTGPQNAKNAGAP